MEKPDETERLLIQSFPIMHSYIIRHIAIKENDINIESTFDVQKGYEEFILFCKYLFISSYPDKGKRDEQLKKYFKILHNELIKMIENEKQ